MPLSGEHRRLFTATGDHSIAEKIASLGAADRTRLIEDIGEDDCDKRKGFGKEDREHHPQGREGYDRSGQGLCDSDHR